MQWCALVTPAFGRLEREDHEFKANLGLYSNSLNKEQNSHWRGEGGSDNLEEILAVPRLIFFFSILLIPRLSILRNNNGAGKYHWSRPLQTSKQMQLLARGRTYRDISVTSACKNKREETGSSLSQHAYSWCCCGDHQLLTGFKWGQFIFSSC